MSRLLQALKQLEAHPAPVASEVAAAPAVPAPPAPDATPVENALKPAETTPPEARQVTERISPRRKRRQARRAEESVSPTAQSALATADEIEKLLSSLGPSVIECWTPHAPQVQTFIEPPQLNVAEPSAPQVVVNDCLPEVAVLQSSDTESTLAIDSPSTELEFTEPTQTEIELDFRREKPRRRAAKKSPARPPSTPNVRESQVRTVVRGPRDQALARPSAWETTIQADLEDARIVGPLTAMIARWQTDRGHLLQTSLLIASLGPALSAAEIAMRAGVLLAQQGDGSVLVVDGDPASALSRRLAITGKPGLCELLAPQDAHGEVIIPTATARLHVLPRGRSEWPAHAQATKITQLFDELAHEYAWILVAGGETTSVPMQALARACRGAYVVAPLGETDLAIAQQSLASLHKAGARVLGAIALNK